MSYSISSTGGEMRWMPMYEFKVRLKAPLNGTGIAKWTGATKQDSNGIFRPLFEIKLDDGSDPILLLGSPLFLTQEDFEFLEPPIIL